MPRLILGSASPRRRELLQLLGQPFEVLPSQVEEVLPERHPDPVRYTLELATSKALEVAGRIPDPEAVVVGADTMVWFHNRLFGKPVDADDAIRILRLLAGRTHRVTTAVCLARAGETAAVLDRFAVETAVTFRPLASEEIRAYVDCGEWQGKAGGYAVQGVGTLLVEQLKGDYPNVVGLPVCRLGLALRQIGFPVLV